MSISVAVNVLASSVQLLCGVLFHSRALIADGLHSLSDLVADLVVLAARRYASRPPDASHPYGHRRIETGASMLLGLMLAFVGVGLLISAVQVLGSPGPVAPVDGVALAVVLLVLVAKELLFRHLRNTARRARSSLLEASAWHARADAASSLVAGIGIAGNLLGLPLLDPVAAALVGAMIARTGCRFALSALRALMDHALPEEDLQQIRHCLLTTDGVRGVHELRARRMGDAVVADAHIEVDAVLRVEAGHEIAMRACARVTALPDLDVTLLLHVDPWTAAEPSLR